MKNISDGDPLRYNDENSDNYVLQYCMDENVGPTLKSEFAKTPYAEFISQSDNIDLINNDKELKKTALMCLIRINAIKNGTITDKRFIQFIKQLYSYKTGNHRGLNVLYKKVKDAVYALVGVGEDGKSCLIKQTPEYSLYEAMELEPDISKIPHATEQDKVFEQFVPEITIGFTVKNASKNSAVELNLDYALYDMLEKLNSGYVFTVNDRNNYANFVHFVQTLMKRMDQASEVIITSKDSNKYILKHNSLGYDFEVLK